MKRAANEAGGGAAVALWQPTLKAAAPCFLIFPDHQNNQICVPFYPTVEDNELDLGEKQSITSLRDQNYQLWDLFDTGSKAFHWHACFSHCNANQCDIFLTQSGKYVRKNNASGF